MVRGSVRFPADMTFRKALLRGLRRFAYAVLAIYGAIFVGLLIYGLDEGRTFPNALVFALFFTWVAILAPFFLLTTGKLPPIDM
jgi:hypothetical protein